MHRTACRWSLLLLMAACLAASPASAGSSRTGSWKPGAAGPLLQAYPGD